MGGRTIALLAGLLDVFCTMMVIGALGAYVYICITENNGPKPPPPSTNKDIAWILSIGFVSAISAFWLIFRLAQWMVKKEIDIEKYRPILRVFGKFCIFLTVINALIFVLDKIVHG